MFRSIVSADRQTAVVCAQFCRLNFDLVDANGKVLSTGHQLSMRDMNRTESIEDMLDAGVSSFKIEDV